LAELRRLATTARLELLNPTLREPAGRGPADRHRHWPPRDKGEGITRSTKRRTCWSTRSSSARTRSSTASSRSTGRHGTGGAPSARG